MEYAWRFDQPAAPLAPRLRLVTALRLIAPPRRDPARSLALRAIVFGSLSAVSAVAVLALSGGLIVKASTQPPVLELTIVIVLVRLFSIVRSVGRYGERLSSHDAALRALERVRILVFAHVARRGPDGTGLSTAGALDRAVADVDRAADLLVRVLVPAISAVAAITIAVAVAAVVSPLAALVIAVACLALGAFVGRAALVAGRHQADAHTVRAGLVSELVTALDAGLELLLAGRTEQQRRTVAASAAQLDEADARHGTLAGALAGLLSVGSTALVVLLAALLATQVDGGSLSGALAAALVLGALATAERLDGLSEAALALPGAAAAVARLAPALLEVQPEGGDSVSADPERHNGGRWTGVADAVLSAGDLSLDRGGRPVLRGVSMELRRGERVAVTGESGSGKSSLLLVLAGMLEPTAGTVLVGGSPSSGTALDHERRSADIVLVPSAPHLFGGTIAANLRLAAPDASERDLRRAVAAVGLSEWVDALPLGLKTVLGDGAVTASGGQRQRLGLARAYLSPAPVLLLDEPASHLPEADAIAALQAVLGARPGRSALLVSHRASEQRLATRELRLGDGRAEACGSAAVRPLDRAPVG